MDDGMPNPAASPPEPPNTFRSVALGGMILFLIFSFFDPELASYRDAILVLNAAIVVHELGHLVLAKLNGIKVIRFSLFFGKPLLRWKWGSVEYQLGWVPLGGYVQPIEGEAFEQLNPELQDEYRKSFPKEVEEMLANKDGWPSKKNPWRQISFFLGGILFNVVTAIAVLTFVWTHWGTTAPSNESIIGTVNEKSPAEASGLKPEDRIVSINGVAISTWDEIGARLKDSKDSKADFEIKRGEQIVHITVKPGDDGRVGILPKFLLQEIGFKDALVGAVSITGAFFVGTAEAIWKMVSFQATPKQAGASGPVGIVKAGSEYAQEGLRGLLSYFALISLALAAMNFLPIPMLDGGYLLFALLQIFGLSLSFKTRQLLLRVGFLLMIALFIVVMISDLWPSLSGLFAPLFS